MILLVLCGGGKQEEREMLYVVASKSEELWVVEVSIRKLVNALYSAMGKSKISWPYYVCLFVWNVGDSWKESTEIL